MHLDHHSIRGDPTTGPRDRGSPSQSLTWCASGMAQFRVVPVLPEPDDQTAVQLRDSDAMQFYTGPGRRDYFVVDDERTDVRDRRLPFNPRLLVPRLVAQDRHVHVGGRLAPLDGMGPERLTFTALVERVRKGGVREVILATSPTLEGDGTALFASNVLAPTGVTVTRLARGLPSGSSLELANAQMLADALDGRRTF